MIMINMPGGAIESVKEKDLLWMRKALPDERKPSRSPRAQTNAAHPEATSHREGGPPFLTRVGLSIRQRAKEFGRGKFRLRIFFAVVFIGVTKST